MTVDYRRQSALFDQQRLKQGRVTLIGSGPMANVALCLLSGLGIGTIRILCQDTVHGFEIPEFLIGKDALGQQKAACLEESVLQMNPDIDVAGRSIGADIAFLGRPHVLVDLTNDPQSKKRAENLVASFPNRYADCQRAILASADEHAATVVSERPGSPLERRIRKRRASRYRQDLFEAYAGKRQGGLASALGAALVVDEIRKTLHPLERDAPLDGPLSACIGSRRDGIEKRRALVVGAGGIGTYVALNLAVTGMGRIDVYDSDRIEAHNLNRQVLYYGRVGDHKASTLRERLQAINPGIDIRSHDARFSEDDARGIRHGQYDIIFSCLDTYAGRKMLSDAAVRAKTPLANGSVTAFDANVDLFVPGMNPCLDCRYDYASLARLDSRPASCAEQESNVVMPNAMAGAMMVDLALCLLAGDKGEYLAAKRFLYASGRSDLHKLMWIPITTEKDAASCGCMRR